MIGKGGWGVVYKGMDEWTAGTVAIKQVKTTGIPADELKGMMVRHCTARSSQLKNEITLLQKLKHENIVRYIDSHIAETAFYIVLEYGKLTALLKTSGSWRTVPFQTH